MEIIINGQQAYLKKNTSFEYISENPLFTGSESYTLTITFPLKDCPENISIFGHINRKDVKKSKVVFDCDIRDKAFFKSGSIVVTEISEVEVKTQFLEGRSEQNFDDTFDDVYLNQLSLGYPDAEERKPANTSVSNAWSRCFPEVNWVALPWVNNSSGNMQNAAVKNGQGLFSWSSEVSSLTFQPYLLYILYKICEVTGYTGNFEAIRNSDYKYLVICNTLPSTWSPWNFAIALPHWSLTEFFEELENFLRGEFTINHKAKTISFEFSYQAVNSLEPVNISEVINKYSVEVVRENKSEYIGAKNLVYAENDNRLWAYLDCQWYIDEHKKEAVEFDSLSDLLVYASSLKISGVQSMNNGHGGVTAYTRGYSNGSEGHKLFYSRDVDTYFIMWCYKSEFVKSTHIEQTNTDYNWYKYYNRLMPVNQFGRLNVDKEAEDLELNIVPAWMDDTDEELGKCLFLECGEMGSAISWTEGTDGQGTSTGGQSGGVFGRGRNNEYGSGSVGSDDIDYNGGALAQSRAGKAIANGKQDKSDAYFDKLYVGYWDGQNRQSDKLPCPVVDSLVITDDFNSITTPYSMRLREPAGGEKYTYDIDNKKKFTFSFLSDVIPNPRALFYIEGSRYVCEKITATFHEGTGKSQLLKGVFYKVI